MPGVHEHPQSSSQEHPLTHGGITAGTAGGVSPPAQPQYGQYQQSGQYGWWGGSPLEQYQQQYGHTQYASHGTHLSQAQPNRLMIPGYETPYEVPTPPPSSTFNMNPAASSFTPRETRRSDVLAPVNQGYRIDKHDSQRRARLASGGVRIDTLEDSGLTPASTDLSFRAPSWRNPPAQFREPVTNTRSRKPRKAKQQQTDLPASDRLPSNLKFNDTLTDNNQQKFTGRVTTIPTRPALRPSPTPPPPPPESSPPPPPPPPTPPRQPVPTQTYLKRLTERTGILDTPRPLLVVLDLNGTLLHRPGKGGTSFRARPFVYDFIEYLFDYHHVMIWSSAMPKNVEGMCNQLLTPDQQSKLVARWGREKLQLSKEQFFSKAQVYKKLSWVWRDEKIRSANPNDREPWGQHNTVLIDDSALKAATEPFNLIQIEQFEGRRDQMSSDVLGQVVGYLEVLRTVRNVSAHIRSAMFQFDPNVTFDWTTVEQKCGDV